MIRICFLNLEEVSNPVVTHEHEIILVTGVDNFCLQPRSDWMIRLYLKVMLYASLVKLSS